MIKLQSDTLTPALDALKSSLPARRRAALKAAGQALCEIANRAFVSAALRPESWPARKDKLSHNLLLKTGRLRNSVKVLSASDSAVVISSDAPYAMVHQFGATITPRKKKALTFRAGKKKVIVKKVKIPARPFFPLSRSGELTPKAARNAAQAIKIKLGLT